MADLGYYIQAPQKGRHSWAIIAYTETPEGRKYIPAAHPTLSDVRERVQAINKQLKLADRKLPDVEIRMKLEEIIKERYRASEDLKTKLRGAMIGGANEDIYRAFWRARYAIKENKDLSSADYDFKRMLRMLGDLPLDTAKTEDLFLAIKEGAPGLSQRRKATSRANEILKHLGRSPIPSPGDDDDEAMTQVKYLTKAEVLSLADSAPEPWLKTAALGLFGTGARIGEFLAITPDDIDESAVYISKQLRIGKKNHGKIGKPKRGKKGWVEILPFCLSSVNEWSEMEKTPEMKDRIWEFIHYSSRALWPKKISKHITTHDLRHSHAIFLIEQGLSLGDVARNLRNNTSTCEKYYTGFAHTEGTRSRISQILNP